MSMNMGIDHNPIDDQEDDFYNELRKQILLLTADDDEEEEDLYDNVKQSLRRPMIIATQPAAGSYLFNCWETEHGHSAPSWLVNLWRNGNGSGTGVFIPHINVKSRRKQRSGKKKNWRRRMSKQVDENKQS